MRARKRDETKQIEILKDRTNDRLENTDESIASKKAQVGTLSNGTRSVLQYPNANFCLPPGRWPMSNRTGDHRLSSIFSPLWQTKDSIICAAHSIRLYRKSSFAQRAQHLVKFAPFSTSGRRVHRRLSSPTSNW